MEQVQTLGRGNGRQWIRIPCATCVQSRYSTITLTYYIMKRRITALLLVASLNACNYLDVVPDNVATLDNAFSMRSMAERYLFTCYSWLPDHGNVFQGNPGFTAGDELWFYNNITTNYAAWRIALGNQNVLNPISNF